MVAPILIGGGLVVAGILALVLFFAITSQLETMMLVSGACAIVYMLYM